MPKQHGAREQKRLAKQRAKRTEKQRRADRANSPNPAIRLQAAADWPIVATLEPDLLWESGIGNLIIARRLPNGRLMVGAFLVDTYCLGVKNAFWKEAGDAEYKAIVAKLGGDRGSQRSISPERFSKLVHSAVDYAQALGFQPHPDFHATRHLMDGIDPSLCDDHFEFGKDGKPFYIAGPNDSATKARTVADRINAAGGHFIIPVAGSSPFGPFDDEDDEAHE